MIPDEIKKPFWTSIAVLYAVYIAFFSIYVLGMGHDNKVEEAAEDFIEHVSGIKIDLSPGEE